MFRALVSSDNASADVFLCCPLGSKSLLECRSVQTKAPHAGDKRRLYCLRSLPPVVSIVWVYGEEFRIPSECRSAGLCVLRVRNLLVLGVQES